MTNQPSPRPLEGKIVIEMGNFIAGPYAGMMLADLGAEVIKIEEVTSGDPFRAWGSGLYSPAFCAFNRGKKSVTLDVRSARGKELLLQLTDSADALIENFRPGVMARLGADYETVSARNPRIVYCSLSGFGQTGPYRDRPSYDTVGQAMGGLLSLLVDPEDPRPRGPALADSLTGLFGAFGIMAGLAAREQTGVGQKVETSQLESVAAFVGETLTFYEANGMVSDTWTRPRLAQVYGFNTADDKALAIHLSSPPKFWEGLTEALGRPDLKDDPRFADRNARAEHYQELYDELTPLFKQRTRDEWLVLFEQHDVPGAPTYRINELVDDPQFQHQDIRTEHTHPAGDSVTAKNPLNMLGTPLTYDVPPPALGEHNAEVLTRLGLDASAIAALAVDGVIRADA
jgi:crotonobetainyl-CoA:carnitine CoA-transferase CaiB-like acyl-CoA transferase